MLKTHAYSETFPFFMFWEWVNIPKEFFPEILHGQMKRQLTISSACAAQAAWCPFSCSNCWHISHQFKRVTVCKQPGVRPTVCSDATFAANAAWRQKQSLESHNTSNYLRRLHAVLDCSLSQARGLILSLVVSNHSMHKVHLSRAPQSSLSNTSLRNFFFNEDAN